MGRPKCKDIKGARTCTKVHLLQKVEGLQSPSSSAHILNFKIILIIEMDSIFNGYLHRLKITGS